MFIISLDSCEVKENMEEALNFVAEINDLLGTLSTGSCASLDGAEQRPSERTHSIEQKLLEMHANQQASVPEPEPVACPKCDKPSVRKRLRERQRTTLCGVIRVKRWEYYCEAKHAYRPWDMKQKFRVDTPIALLNGCADCQRVFRFGRLLRGYLVRG